MANGAQIIDVNIDEGMLDLAAGPWPRFLSLIAGQPDIAGAGDDRSSKWTVIEAGLKCVARPCRSSRSAWRSGGSVPDASLARCMRYGAAWWWSWFSMSKVRPTPSSARSVDLLKYAAVGS